MSLLLTQLTAAAHTRSLSDTITLTDVIANRPGVGQADTVTLTDAITSKEVALVNADSISFADLLTTAEQNVLALSDTINLSDLASTTSVFIRTAADTITLSDFESHVAGTGHTRTASDTINLSDLASTLLVSGHLVSAADTITLSDAATLSHTAGVAEEEFPEQFAGLRVWVGDQMLELCLVAVEDAPTDTGGVLKIRLDDATYAIYLVAVDDENASPVRIRTSNGTWAIRLKT